MNSKAILIFFLLFAPLYAEDNCPFCDPAIIDKQEVYRGSHWRVLVDYKPILNGHLLLVPIEHRLTRHELTREEHNELYDIEQKVYCVFLQRFGNNVEDFQYEKNGPTLQSVNHFHIHAIPFEGRMKSLWDKMRLFTQLFLFTPSALSEDELILEKTELKMLFEQCDRLSFLRLNTLI